MSTPSENEDVPLEEIQKVKRKYQKHSLSSTKSSHSPKKRKWISVPSEIFQQHSWKWIPPKSSKIEKIKFIKPKINLKSQLESVSWNMKHFLVEALTFFWNPENSDLGETILQLRSQVSPKYKIPLVQLIYYFISIYSHDYYKLCVDVTNSNIDAHFIEEEIALFSRCTYLVQLITKKNLEPSKKEVNRFIWPGISLSLSVSDLLFFWFVLKYQVAHFCYTHCKVLETICLEKSHPRTYTSLFKSISYKK